MALGDRALRSIGPEGRDMAEPARESARSEDEESSDEERRKGKPKSYANILDEEVHQGLTELERPATGLFLSAISAGLDLGFSLLLIAAIRSRLGTVLSPPSLELAGIAMYPIGFVFVVLGRSELFTEHTTRAVFPVLERQASV